MCQTLGKFRKECTISMEEFFVFFQASKVPGSTTPSTGVGDWLNFPTPKGVSWFSLVVLRWHVWVTSKCMTWFVLCSHFERCITDLMLMSEWCFILLKKAETSSHRFGSLCTSVSGWQVTLWGQILPVRVNPLHHGLFADPVQGELGWHSMIRPPLGNLSASPSLDLSDSHLGAGNGFFYLGSLLSDEVGEAKTTWKGPRTLNFLGNQKHTLKHQHDMESIKA